ncbi:hydroxycarboxylic acid receptor 2-like [Pangasianodon hypophthalmus]|uniref:hydroxycarboxylic acid receptor 2-like n=1 Tax=Pangasianodon hypophthalmus TaxID=310915 RepID=UPI000EFE57F1|nr:hydroxycarboxylic acid receptor 2-like [Pangasianodon hypophthalmus]
MSNSSICCAFETPILDKLLPSIFIMEFIFGITGNILALVMFAFEVDSWKPNSIYLAHLAVADSVVLFFMPFKAFYYIKGQDWIFGGTFCSIMLFLLAASRASSIFFLTAVAVDRYLKIVHPLHRINRMNLKYAMWVSLGLWAMGLLMTTQVLGSQNSSRVGSRIQCGSFSICFNSDPLSSWHNAFYVIQFCVPGSIIIFCTACITWQLKTKTMDTTGKVKRAVHFIFIVAMVFFVCFLPSTASRVAITFLRIWYKQCSYFSEANLIFYFSVCFTYFNSALNPLVYYFSTPAFSGTVQKFFRRFTGQKEEKMSGEMSVSTVTSS